MRIKNLDERVKLLRDLVKYAQPTQWAKDNLVYLYGPTVTAGILAEMTSLCQFAIHLPIYTVSHAAAWLGMSKRGIVEAYRSGRLPYIQPGREVLFLHEDLVKFANERRGL